MSARKHMLTVQSQIQLIMTSGGNMWRTSRKFNSAILKEENGVVNAAGI